MEPKKIEVRLGKGGKQTLEARYILIASGSAPRSLPGLEIDHKHVLTSGDVLTMNSLPSSLVILESGAVGVEFASMYRDFGVEVTVVEILDRIVPGEDAEVSAMLKKCFAEERGVRVLTNAKADPMSLQETNRGVTIGVFTEGGAEILSAEALLVAVGRRTITEGLNVEATGVETNARGEILVDECYRTAEPGVYAAGDVIGATGWRTSPTTKD